MLYQAGLVTHSYIKTYDITVLFLKFLTSQNLSGSLYPGVYDEQGNYNSLREKVSNTDWVAIQNVDINIYAKYLFKNF